MRLTAILVFFALSGVTAMGSADAAALPRATVRFSGVAAFVKSLFADSVGLPQQVSGTAAGKGGQVPTAATRAGGGSGRAPGKGAGELAAYSPLAHKSAAGRSGAAHTGFDAKTSVRNARKSSAFSDWYDNADGSYTVKTSQTPVNYRDADGVWQRIDPTLTSGADGRLHERANSVGISFAGGNASAGSTSTRPRGDLAGSRVVRSSDSPAVAPPASTGELVSLSLGGSDEVGWSLSGAASVDPVVSGNTAEYDGILADTNLSLASEDWGVKETFTLASGSAPNSWTFPLALSGVSVVEDPTYGWELVDGTGAVAGRLSVPFAYDSVVVDAQHPNSTYAVTYSLITDGTGAQSLVMTLDKAWLDDPARVFPVTVDPSVTVGDAGVRASTYIEWSESNVDNSSTGRLHVGYSDWSSPTVKSRSFIYFDTMPAASGYHVTQANVGIFDIWAATCTAEPFDIYPVTDSSWTNTSIGTRQTWTDQAYTGPSVGASMGEVSASPGAACTNTSGTYSTGTWMLPQLDTNVVNQWTATNPSSYHGIEIAAPSESNDLEWKIFDSTLVSSYSPYIYITYTPDAAPQVNSTSPASGYNSPTLTPTLSANATDPDNWPNQKLGYEYQLYDGADDKLVADSQPGAQCGGGTKPSAGSSWAVPSGKLTWGQSYYWSVVACDGYAASVWAASSGLVTAVPPPLLTSNLSQNSSGHGFDPALGNYTASATDAQVATAGPELAITRDYNSLDPRITQSFGAGWSSLLDAQAAEQYDASGSNVLSVTVTYPDGSQVGFGQNSDGSFSPPLGRFAWFASVPGGYTLTDKNGTVYRFAHQTATGSGVYRITSVTDAAGRVLEVRYSAATGGTATRFLSDTSGRSLFFTWFTPSGATTAHVQKVSTDPVTSDGVTAALTWTYHYTGDQLSSVCPPTSTTACTGYSYQSGSQYRTALLDGGPTAYWPLSETSGTAAGDLVLANEHGKDATYSSSVILGAAGNLTGSTAKSASFNGSSSQATTSGKVLDTTVSFTVSAWVNLNSTSGFQAVVAQDGSQNSGFELGYDGAWAFSRPTSDTGSATSVKARAPGSPVLHTPTFLVGVYDAAAGVLRLYLNGTQVATAPYTASVATSGSLTIGRGKWSGASTDFFNGLISDVAVYQNALPAATINALYQAGTTATSMVSEITRPSGNVAAQVAYDTVTGRVRQVTDGNGSVWSLGSPSVSGSAEGYRAAVMGSAPSGYWRLGDAAQSSFAYDEVAEDTTVMTYYAMPSLGVSGPLSASQSAVTLDGSTQYAATRGAVLNTTKPFSVSAWAKLSATGSWRDVVTQDGGQDSGFYLQYDPADNRWALSMTSADSASAATTRALSSAAPAVGAWTHLVGTYDPTASSKQLRLYVNGVLSGTADFSAAWGATGALAIGRGKFAGTATDWFSGSVAEVAVYPSVLDGATVAAMYAAGKNAAGLNPTETVTITDPDAKTLSYEYDPVNGTRLIAQIDGLGAKTTYGYDTAGFLHTVVDANGDETITGHDVRGNAVSRTTCQNQLTNSCSTSYYTYLPDDTTAQLKTASPSNDMLATASDARSASADDKTYRTTYGYDNFGDRTTVTTPPVPGYPGGRTATTVYTDGTIKYPASDDQTKPVPAGLPWTQTSAGGAVTQYKYDADGDLYSATSPTSGMVSTFSYDQLGRPTQKTETYATSAACPVASSTSGCPTNALTTTMVYDGLNRTVQVTAPATTDRVNGNVHQAQTTTVYDVDGNQISQTVSDVGTAGPHDTARTTVSHYDSHDRVDWSMDAQQAADGGGTGPNPDLTKATQYRYGDPYGHRTQVISAQDQNGRSTVTDYQYDPDGRLRYTILEGYTGSPSGSQAAADLTEEARSYDPAGRLASVADAMGFITSYTYYDDDRTATVTRCRLAVIRSGVGGGCAEQFTQESDSYDGAGNLTKRLTNNGTTETDYTYDAAARQTSSTLDPHGLNRTTTNTYNGDDLVVSQRTGDVNGSGTTDYQYNADGAMTAQSVEDYTTGAPSGWWKLNDGAAGAATPSTAQDWSGQNNTGTLDSGVTWASGAASFDGTSGQITTGATPINTAASYSVSAWVNFAAAPTAYSTVVGAPGSHNGAFYLQYSSSSGGWAFVTTSADAAGETQYASTAAATPAAGTWYHLVGVRDAQAGTIKLYVDAAAASAVTQTAAWSASKGLSIGSAANGGNYVKGQVANVQVYPRALTLAEVQKLYDNGAGRTEGALSAPSNTTTWALDGRDLPTSMTDADGNVSNYVFDEAGRRTITEQPTVTTGTYSASTGYTPASAIPTTSTGYDTFGDEVESKDPTNMETDTWFDADGRPTATTLPDYQQPGSAPNNQLLAGERSKSQYNELGQQIATWDPAGVQTTYSYDQLGHVTTQTQDAGGVNQATTTTAYDPDGDVGQVTDPAGNIQAATYDYLGRTESVTQVLGLGGSGSTQIPTGCSQYNNVATEAACTTTYSYTDTAGFLSKVTTPSNTQSTQYGYDATGERISVTDGVNQTTTTGYDYAGRPGKTTLPDGTYSTTTYDEAGNVIAEAQYDASNNLLRSASAGYDADGNVQSTTDPNGNTTHYQYDPAGRLISETQPASYTSTLPQVASVTQTITTGFGYDAAGRQTEYVSGGVGPANTPSYWYNTYNSRGLLETTVAPPTTAYTSPASSTTTLTYNADGRPVEQDAPGGVVQTRGYDHLGQVISQGGSSNNPMDAPTATRTFTYYPSGLIKTASTANTATSGSNATSESFTYDDSGALVTTAGSAGTSAFSYTADGQMASRTDTIGGTAYPTSYSYDGAGRIQAITEPLTGQNLTFTYTPNKLDYTITYGANGDVRSFQYNAAHELSSDILETPGTSGSVVASISYGYDPNGNEISKKTAGFTGAATNGYTYDQANRLKSWTNGTTVTGYGYDQDGNRTNVAGNTYTYDARDELTSDGTNTYAYTARGTLQSTTSAAGPVTTSADAFGQMQTDATDAYTYDALGRVVQRGATVFDYSGTDNTLSYDGSTVYARDPAGNLLADLQTAGNGRIDLTDRHSDVVGYLNPATGGMTGSAAYDPLGQVLSVNGHHTNLGYQSAYTSPATGKLDMAARWYNPAIGQFTSKDSVTNSPVPNGANANPFAYGNDNPLTNTDPSGHRACGDVGQCFGTTSAAGRSGAAEATAYNNYQAIQARQQANTANIISRYIENEDTRCGARQGCVTARIRALQSIKVGKDGHTLTGNPAAIADLKSIVGGGDDSSADQGDEHQNKPCNWSPLTWGGCASNAVHWVAKHPLETLTAVVLIAGVVLAGITLGPLAFAAAGELANGIIGGSAMVEFGTAVVTGATEAAAPGSIGAGYALAAAGEAGMAPARAADEAMGSEAADSAGADVSAGVDAGGSAAADDASTALMDSSTGTVDISASTIDSIDADFNDARLPAESNPATPTPTPESTNHSDLSSTKQEPASAVSRTADGQERQPAAVGSGCSGVHSFTGSTPVLMADGTTKPIDRIKAGDKITNAAPGGANETHTVEKVIVTTTDHDFAALTITPIRADNTGASANASTRTGNGSNSGARAKIAGVALTAALVLTSASGAAGYQATSAHSDPARATNLTTTYHHEFYDVTTNQWTQAENLRPGDLLQTPTGHALLADVHLYHADTTTYDLTIGDLHTYYVVAGSTPVLVHNCGTGTARFAVDSNGTATDLQAPLFRADDRHPDEIFGSGFQPKGDNLNIYEHVHSNPEDSGFISTSSTEAAARQFAKDNYMDTGFIYKLRGSGIDVNARFGDASPFPYEEEIAVPGPIESHNIEGAWSIETGEWFPNSGWRQ